MPSSSGAARSFSPVPAESVRLGSPKISGAAPRRCATPSMPSTRGASAPSKRAPRIPEKSTPPSTRGGGRLYARCSTTTPGSTANKAACGPYGWPPRSASRRALPRGRSAARPSGQRLQGLACAGSGPNAGWRAPIRTMPAKRGSRSADQARSEPPRVGFGLRGRELVLPLRAAFFAFVDRCREAPHAPPPERTYEGRSRAEGPLLLRAVPAGARRDLAEVRGRPAGERHNHTVPRVVLREAPPEGQGSFTSHLGQR